jgi:hypothetical protein
MKKYSIALLLAQFVAFTVISMAEAKELSFACEKTNKQEEAKDLEAEINKETDVFPDIITFATNLYQ